MKNLYLGLALIMGLFTFGLSGCGGTTETTVVEPDQPEVGLTAEEQAEYEAEMMAEQGN